MVNILAEYAGNRGGSTPFIHEVSASTEYSFNMFSHIFSFSASGAFRSHRLNPTPPS